MKRVRRVRKIKPSQLVLNMIPKKCKTCETTQYCYFLTQEEFLGWTCPVCRENPVYVEDEMPHWFMIDGDSWDEGW